MWHRADECSADTCVCAKLLQRLKETHQLLAARTRGLPHVETAGRDAELERLRQELRLVAGPLVTLVVGVLQSAVVVGGLSALGAGPPGGISP